MIRLLAAFLLVSILAGCQTRPKLHLLFGVGAIHAPIQGKDLLAEIQAVRGEVDTAGLTGLPQRYGRLDLGLEVYGGITFRPRSGHFEGVTPFLRYTYPLTDRFASYVEAGAGPAILGLTTHEQEKSGFAFHDQVGAGVVIQLGGGMSLLIGYRFSHISHGGVRGTRNRGIEASSISAWLSFTFP